MTQCERTRDNHHKKLYFFNALLSVKRRDLRILRFTRARVWEKLKFLGCYNDNLILHFVYESNFTTGALSCNIKKAHKIKLILIHIVEGRRGRKVNGMLRFTMLQWWSFSASHCSSIACRGKTALSEWNKCFFWFLKASKKKLKMKDEKLEKFS